MLQRILAVMLLAQLANAQSVEVTEATIGELQDAMATGRVTSVQLVEQYLARISAYDAAGAELNSVISINPLALESAGRLDQERQRGQVRGPLHGIPVILKDNYNTDFMPTTGASVALAGFAPSANATAVDRLIAAGAVILAKSNLHEFAYGITTISSLGGQTRNPYDPRRVPGGSSGGTAAAVAASLAAVGMGSDTCGSIRIPAAFNNLVGLRPSKGVTSIHGIMPLSHTQDVIGPLARNVADLAVVLDVVAGHDPLDPATEVLQGERADVFRAGLASQPLSGLRLGRLVNYFEDADPALRGVVDAALEQLRVAGVEIVDVDIPDLAARLGGSGVIGHEFRADLDQYLARFLSRDVANLNDVVDLGLFHQAVAAVLARSRASVRNDEAYAAALASRDELRQTVETLMEGQDLDALVYPPISRLQVFTGENQPGNNCSLSANSGLPAIAVPAGFTSEGLPVGIELLGGYLDDVKLVSIAWQWEQLAAPRRAPRSTPVLVDGAVPPAQEWTQRIAEQGVELEVTLSYDPVHSRLRYLVQNESGSLPDLYAVSLMSDEPQAFALADPLLARLIGPGRAISQGELYLTPQLDAAWREQRLYLKLFGRNLPVAGIPWQVTAPR